MICVYCKGINSKKITKEHLISRSVLEAIFGQENRNITKSDLFGGKVLIDHEHKVRDVCDYCNNKLLSPYDKAGANFVKEISKSYDATDKQLTVDFKILAWLLKTHLNHIRIIPERGTKNYYPISQDIYTGIIKGDISLFSRLKLFVEGWQGLPYFWDENDGKKIQFFSYRSVCFPYQKILVSNFRIKWLDTFIVIPSDLDYSDFEQRVNLTIDAMKANYGFYLQSLDAKTAIEDGRINIEKIVKTEELLKVIKLDR